MQALNAMTTVAVFCTLAYAFVLFLTSRRRWPALPARPDDLFFVFLVPCLNEALVLGPTLERLLALPAGNFAVLVIDDGSDDGTGEIARRFDPGRVWLLRRDRPDARQGKGEALNAAYRLLRDWAGAGGRDPHDVIVAVLDADGRIAANALAEVSPYFHDPLAAAVQIGVRMRNAGESLLTRMQDIEFVIFTEVFQRARQRIGSVGLGGNGQFVRLSALASLGDAPWTDCLTEDLDLGVRLLAAGWRNNFCPTSDVNQQAVTGLGRLLRQRARWFQGHLQCWKRIPLVLRSGLPGGSSIDLLYHLTSPSLVLIMSVAMVGFVLGLAGVVVSDPAATLDAVRHPDGPLLALLYGISFGLAPFYGFVYWRRDRETGLLRAVVLAHLFHLFAYLWFVAGWMAVWRILVGRRSWTKTARTPEPSRG